MFRLLTNIINKRSGMSRNCPGGVFNKASESTAENTMQKIENLFILIWRKRKIQYFTFSCRAFTHNDAATATVLVHYQYFNIIAKYWYTKKRVRAEHKRKRGISKNVDDVFHYHYHSTTKWRKTESRGKKW